MKVTRKEVAFEGKYIRVVRKHFQTDSGEGVWETVERTNTHGRGAVVIIPLTGDKKLVLEKNFRVPPESWVIQFPAGLTDVRGESDKETARRELLEETGYLAKELIPIIPAPLSPDLTATRAMHYLAPDVEFTGRKGELSPDESVSEILTIPLERLDEFLLNLPEGTELDLRVPGIIWILERKGLIPRA